jgi:hypothetical protein
MSRRFETQYKTKRLDNLGDPEWHDRRWQDIDLRMHAREIDASKIDDAVDRMESVALARLNDTFSPIIQQAMNQLADVGVSFSGQSLSEHTIGLGEKSFVITEQYRVGLVVVDFVSIRPTGVEDAAMICSVISYDRETGTLLVAPQVGYITGAGTYDDWQIRVSVTPNLDTYSREEVDGQIALAIDGVVDDAPLELNTLKKLADALGGPLTTLMLRANNLSDLTNATVARANIGLGNVNNTADVNKPVSAPTQAAINAATAAVFPTGTTMIFYNAVVPTGWVRMTTHNDKTMRIVNTTGGGSGGTVTFSTVFARTAVDNTTLTAATIPAHNHTMYDPTHIHGVGDPSHAHSVADPTHAHSVYDPTHAHSGYTNYNYTIPDYPGFLYPLEGGNRGMGYDNTINTYGAYTGIGIYGAYTGIGIYGAGTGIYLGYAGTGVSTYNTGSSQPHSHGCDMRVQYVDVLIGVKS